MGPGGKLRDYSLASLLLEAKEGMSIILAGRPNPKSVQYSIVDSIGFDVEGRIWLDDGAIHKRISDLRYDGADGNCSAHFEHHRC